jgi:hypothetical protein
MVTCGEGRENHFNTIWHDLPGSALSLNGLHEGIRGTVRIKRKRKIKVGGSGPLQGILSVHACGANVIKGFMKS